MNPASDIRQAYSDLDLPPGASAQEVKEAYRRLARALHPDLNPQSLGVLMTRVNNAYHRLIKHLAADMPENQPGSQKDAKAAGAQARPYRYQEIHCADEAHGRAARRRAARRKARREFYRRAVRAAEAAARRAAAEAEDSPAPRAPRSAGGRVRREEQPAAAAPLAARPRADWRLLGLVRRDGRLVYQVEVSGDPRRLDLPVRCRRPCRACRGSGRRPDDRRKPCPACGGRGRSIRSDLVRVDLPRDWRPGRALIVSPPGRGWEVMVELSVPGTGAEG